MFDTLSPAQLPVAPLSILGGLLLSAAGLAAMALASRRLVAARELRRFFLTHMDHELRTPLAGLRLMAETMAMEEAQDPALGRRLLLASDQLARAVERLGAALWGEGELVKDHVDPAAAVGAAVQRWRETMDVDDITMEVPELPPLPPLWTSRRALALLLDIAMDDAVARRRPCGGAWIRLAATAREDREVVFEVTDNGAPQHHRGGSEEQGVLRLEGGCRATIRHLDHLSLATRVAALCGGTAGSRPPVDGERTFVISIPLSGRSVRSRRLDAPTSLPSHRQAG